MAIFTKTRDDKEVREDLVAELDWDPQITSEDIGVAVKDGVVALSGFVKSYQEKGAAESAAKRVRGVRGVANELEVKLGDVYTDADIARDAVEALKRHVFIPSDRIKVTVRDGWVTLEGIVSWRHQRNVAENSLKTLKGVVGITNNILLKPEVSATDVKKKIEQALERNARVDAEGITVEADGNTVTLSGAVRSWVERDEADQAAWSAPGVDQVNNRLQIVARP